MAPLESLTLLLARWAQRINLTGHRTPEAIARRLILDALALSEVLPPWESLADLGSGAGFPGLPLAIARPEGRVTLVESRQRRHHFQRAAVRELGLRNLRLRLGRAESLEPEPHDAAVAQALARPARALEWLLPWVRPGGHLLIPGGPAAPELLGDPRVAGGAEVVRYRVPLGGPERTLWRGRRA